MKNRQADQETVRLTEMLERFEKRLSKYSEKAIKPDIQEGKSLFKLACWILIFLAFQSIALLAVWIFGKALFNNVYELLGLFLFFICPLLALALRLLGKTKR